MNGLPAANVSATQSTNDSPYPSLSSNSRSTAKSVRFKSSIHGWSAGHKSQPISLVAACQIRPHKVASEHTWPRLRTRATFAERRLHKRPRRPKSPTFSRARTANLVSLNRPLSLCPTTNRPNISHFCLRAHFSRSADSRKLSSWKLTLVGPLRQMAPTGATVPTLANPNASAREKSELISHLEPSRFYLLH